MVSDPIEGEHFWIQLASVRRSFLVTTPTKYIVPRTTIHSVAAWRSNKYKDRSTNIQCILQAPPSDIDDGTAGTAGRAYLSGEIA